MNAKVKVCHITSGHPRFDTRIYHKECVSLAKAGYDVSLIVNDIIDDIVLGDVKIISTSKNPNTKWKRVALTKKQMHLAIECDCDIYHLHEPNLLFVGRKLKKMGKSVIFDSHEDFPKHISQSLPLPKLMKKLISILYSNIEKHLVKKFDALIGVSPQIVERLNKSNKNSYMITNYPFKENNQWLPRKNKKNIAFVGGISSQWNHINILDAIEEIENITYTLAGYGNKDYISKLKQHPAWSKVDYRGHVTKLEVEEIYTNASLGLVLNYSDQVKDVGTLGNTKLFECMNYYLPVLCTNYTLWQTILDKYDCGYTVNPLDPQSIRVAITEALSNSEELVQKGKNGKKAVDTEYNWETQNLILLKIYKKIVEN
jgi:glycosyltransferase involved in cell wall biosynthesis